MKRPTDDDLPNLRVEEIAYKLTPGKKFKPRSYEADLWVGPDEIKTLIAGTTWTENGLEGVPETGRDVTGVERDFIVRYLLVSKQCAPAFEVSQIIAGNRVMWVLREQSKGVPGFRFVGAGSPLLPETPIGKGICLAVTVKNVAKEAVLFKARFLGLEVVEG